MKQTKAIHQALKRLIRARDYTYADAARVLALSEASIKRLFSTATLSLQRIERLCDWLQVEVADLVALSEQNKPIVTQLNERQERKLLSDPALLLVTFLVLNRWSEDEILQAFDFTRPRLTLLLADIEKLGLIEVLPFGRIKLRTARNFSWRADGPVQRYFADRILPDFLGHGFQGSGEQLRFLGGSVSEAGLKELRELIDEWARRFDDIVERDLALPLAERQGVGLLLALRPWEFTGFTALRRKD